MSIDDEYSNWSSQLEKALIEVVFPDDARMPALKYSQQCESSFRVYTLTTLLRFIEAMVMADTSCVNPMGR